MKLDVIFEDNHLIVVNKPPLLPTMGTAPGETSLLDGVKGYLKQKYHKPGNVYLGVVSRLDAWVSGLVVLARTSKAAGRLSDQFRQRIPQKKYLAITPDLAGFPEFGTLQDRLLKNESYHKMVCLPLNNSPALGKISDSAGPATGQLAILHYQTLAIHQGQRLLAIELETGRKHQIRTQLASRGCPILGDRKYGSTLEFSRGIALHSGFLEIVHPIQKEKIEFKAVPPGFWRLDRFGTHTFDKFVQQAF